MQILLRQLIDKAHENLFKAQHTVEMEDRCSARLWLLKNAALRKVRVIILTLLLPNYGLKVVSLFQEGPEMAPWAPESDVFLLIHT